MATKYNTRNAAVKRILQVRTPSEALFYPPVCWSFAQTSVMQELKEVQNDSSADYLAEAVEDNIFEWHYVIRGPADSEFAVRPPQQLTPSCLLEAKGCLMPSGGQQGGIYHGRILLPADYPFKPPSFMMLTPNGRFETNTKICLSISSYHPEHWQPSWSMRTALTALIAFLPTHGQGAIGSLVQLTACA